MPNPEPEPEQEQEQEQEQEREEAASPLSADADPPPNRQKEISRCEVELTTAWNAVEGISHVRTPLSPKRRKQLSVRLSDPEFAEDWPEAIDCISRSAFLCGQNDRGWKANLDWFLRPDIVTKIIEGQYDNGNGNGQLVGAGQGYDPHAKDKDPRHGQL